MAWILWIRASYWFGLETAHIQIEGTYVLDLHTLMLFVCNSFCRASHDLEHLNDTQPCRKDIQPSLLAVSPACFLSRSACRSGTRICKAQANIQRRVVGRTHHRTRIMYAISALPFQSILQMLTRMYADVMTYHDMPCFDDMYCVYVCIIEQYLTCAHVY